MSIKDFQNFIASDPQLQNSPFGPCVRVVNLLHLHDPGIPYGFAPMQVAFAAAAQRRQIPLGRGGIGQVGRVGMMQRGTMAVQPLMVQNRVALVLDAESCLDRLYGGYFPGTCFVQLVHYLPLKYARCTSAITSQPDLIRLNNNFFGYACRLELWGRMATHVLFLGYNLWSIASI